MLSDPLISETDDVFHYTRADAAISILQTRQLRLGSFDAMNDLREARQYSPGFTSHADDAVSLAEGDAAMTLMENMDWWLRRLVKVASFTRSLPQTRRTSIDVTAGLGWAHPAMWAHYGAGHTGACLRFSRPALQAALREQYQTTAQVYTGDVHYPSNTFPSPAEIAASHVAQFGLDAAVLDYVERWHRELLFTKNPDWAPESEFRLVTIGTSLAPAYLDIRSALTGIYLGESFSPSQWDLVAEILAETPGVEVFGLRYFSRQFWALPPQAARRPPTITARETGSLAHRLTALRTARRDRERAEALAQETVRPVMDAIARSVADLREALTFSSDIEFETHGSSIATPAVRSQRAPGVPGEVIDYQTGWSVSCNPDFGPPSRYGNHTLHAYEAHIGMTVLPDGTCRLDALLRHNRSQLGDSQPLDARIWREGPVEVNADVAGQEAACALVTRLEIAAVENLRRLTQPVEAIRQSLAANGVPHCSVCGEPMEPVEDHGTVRWQCSHPTPSAS